VNQRARDEIKIGVLAGLISGFVGALLFAAAHAILIVPIWDRMWSGLVLGPLAGALGGWALAELTPGYLTMPLARAAATGALFGAILFLLVVPVTAADLLLRETGIAPRFELVAVGVAVVLAVGTGAAFGSRRTRTRRGMIAGALATLSLTIAMAGPVPVARSPRALGIFLVVLPVAAAAGALFVLVARGVHRLRGPGASSA
jgi:hypothetical protein